MTVTKIETVAKSKYRIYVDGQFAFVLYKSELSRYRIIVDSEISEKTYDEIMNSVIIKRARLRALHLLNAMGRTEQQLRDKLKQNEYPDSAIEDAVFYVKSFGYINDKEYARSFIDSRKNKKSKKELYVQLSGKGLGKELLDEVFEEFYDSEDSKDAIYAILRKKKYDPDNISNDEKRKIMSYLVRKGFVYEDIRQVIQVSEWNA